MFYEPARRNHGLRYDPFKALVAPRPIGWIGTKGKDGSVNLAPYSFFNAVAGRPPMVMFSSEGEKDSIRNLRETGEFTCSIVGLDLAEAMNVTSAGVARGVDEFQLAGLRAVPSRLVGAPYVAGAPAALECRLLQIIEPLDLDGQRCENIIAIGQVVGVHIEDWVIEDGLVKVERFKPVARLGYNDYAAVERVFEMGRPANGGNVLQK